MKSEATAWFELFFSQSFYEKFFFQFTVESFYPQINHFFAQSQKPDKPHKEMTSTTTFPQLC